MQSPKQSAKPYNLYWDCKMIDDRDASVYVVAETTTNPD